MSQLASIQFALQEALRGKRPASAVPHVREADSISRIEIHRRNYQASLTESLRAKFPGTCWLVGEGFLDYGARRFVERNPPGSPCIAEYGFDFTAFLSSLPGTLRLPYLTDFMKLEWFFGKASVAVPVPAFLPSVLEILKSTRLLDSTVELQPGLFYLATSWPVDTLLDLYLTETAPDSLEFEPNSRWLEISGSRGDVRVVRLPKAEFVFREALRDGRTLGRSAESALRCDPQFDLKEAIGSLAGSGLMVGVRLFDYRRQAHERDK